MLRECKVCNGTDEALLKGGADNEKTFLLSRWFHCVKLPADVLAEDHPFHNLFTLEKPEHLFVSTANGSSHDPLESQTSRSELWKSMRKLLAAEYKSKPDPALKKISRLLGKMDEADSRFDELARRRDDVLEKDGPESRKLVKIGKAIAKIKAERLMLRVEVAKASALQLKEREKAAGSAQETGV